MITPIYVELVQYDANGRRIESDEAETGIVVSEHLIPVPDQSSATGLRFQATLGVCWDNSRVPAISYHSPEELEWLSVGLDDSNDNAEDDYSAEEYVETVAHE